jgi:hypothetical protein
MCLSDADSLIASQQLATSTPRPWIFDQTTSIIGASWVCCSGGVAGPGTDHDPAWSGSDHVRCPPQQDPITRACAVSTIAWDRCHWIACRLVRGCVPPRSADGPRSIGTGGSCRAGRAALACAAEPHVVSRLRVLSPPVMALLGVFCFKLSGRPVVRA